MVSGVTVQSQRPSPGSSRRLQFVDGLRGCAMLMVLLYHCWLFGGQWTISLPLPGRPLHISSVLSLGHVGVNLFLVLSGFCLYWPFAQGGRREPSLKEFAKRRCRRILPPYYAALLLLGVPAWLAGQWGHNPQLSGSYMARWLGLHALMLHNLRPEYVLALNGALWSLALESQLYVLFPALVEAYRRVRPSVVLLAVLAVSSAYRYVVASGPYLVGDEEGYVLAYSVFGRCFEFALGMYAATLVSRRQAGRKLELGALLPVVAAAVVALAIWDGRHGHFRTLTDAMWGVLFAGLLVWSARPGCAPNRVLSGRWIAGCGVFSYSVYLIHLPLVTAAGSWAASRGFTNAANIVFQVGLVAPAVIGLGYLFHLRFEKPFMIHAPRRDPPQPALAVIRAPEDQPVLEPR